MFLRSATVCSVLAVASIAHAGVTVQLVPNAACFEFGQTYDVDVRLSQNAGGVDQVLRMIELDLLPTTPSLNVSLPVTHPLPPPEEIRFWLFSSLTQCANVPSFCGFNHYRDDDLPAGPVDTRANVLAIAYHALSADNQAQILLKGDGTPVTVGRLQVTMPAVAGAYQLNVVNAADADAVNRRARVDFGFDTHTIWRAGAAAPNDVSGGTFTFQPIAECPSGGCDVTKWESIGTHAQGVGDVALDIPNNNNFSEPRNGIKKLRVTFSGAVDPTTAIPGNVIRCGNNSAGSPIDLSGVTVTTAAINGNTQMDINFAPQLPDFGRYRVALNGVKCVGGAAAGAGAGGLSRILTALQGEANGDRRVNATDVGGCRSLVPRTPINPAVLNEVRCDANNDGRINATDVGGIRSKIPNNATAIPDPVCP